MFERVRNITKKISIERFVVGGDRFERLSKLAIGSTIDSDEYIEVDQDA